MRYFYFSNKSFISLFEFLALSVLVIGCAANNTPPQPKSTSSQEQSIKVEVSPEPSLTLTAEIPEATPTTATSSSSSEMTQSTPVLTQTTSTSTTSTIEGRPPVYFVTKEEAVAQIWQVSPGEKLSSSVYEINRTDVAANAVLPSEELERLNIFLEEMSDVTQEVKPEPQIEHLVLSPTKEALAWTELDWFCVQQTTPGCFGVSKLMILDIASSVNKVIFELPLDDGTNFISAGPVWSPNGQYVAILHEVRQTGSTPVVIDAHTGQVKEYMGTFDTVAPLIWSPDSLNVAWIQLTENETYIRSCSVDSEICDDFEVEDFSFQGIDWGPYGEQIVYTGSGGFILNLFDPASRVMKRIPANVNGTLENPRWSPNSQLLAVDNRINTKPSTEFQSLLIIEPHSGQVITQLQQERSVSEWVWATDGHSILILVGTRSNGYELGIYTPHDNELEILEIPDHIPTQHVMHLNW